MTQPFHFTDSDTESNRPPRDPSEYLDFKRVCELDTARGKRPGKLMIVRPLEKIQDYREKDPDKAWKTLVVADIAILESVPPASDEFGNELPPINAGAQFRNQVIYPGMLCKAWRDQIGNTLIGVVFLGLNEKGQPPFLWRSLAKVPAATDLGQRFMLRFPNFLIPVPREKEAAEAAESWATQPTSTTPSADPWAQHSAHPAQANAAPVSAPPQSGWTQSADPWGQGPSEGVAPAQQPDPRVGMSALDQMRQQAQMGTQGEPPF